MKWETALSLCANIEERPCEDKVRSQPSVCQGKSSHQKPNPLAPWFWTSQPIELENKYLLSQLVYVFCDSSPSRLRGRSVRLLKLQRYSQGSWVERGNGQNIFPVNRPCGGIFSEHMSGEAQSGQPTPATERSLGQCFLAAFGRTWTEMT